MPNSIQQAPFKSTYTALNDVNDPYPFQTSPTASGALNSYIAALGSRIWLDGSTSGVRYDTAVGTLYGGEFQYVQSFLTSTASPAVGTPAVWAWDQANGCFESYIVSPDAGSAVRVGRFAGVYINALTKGNYGWIQVTGKANVLFKSSLTAATPADGDMICLDVSSGLADDPTQSTTLTYLLLKAAIGTAIGAPVANQLNLVLLRQINFVT